MPRFNISCFQRIIIISHPYVSCEGRKNICDGPCNVIPSVSLSLCLSVSLPLLFPGGHETFIISSSSSSEISKGWTETCRNRAYDTHTHIRSRRDRHLFTFPHLFTVPIMELKWFGSPASDVSAHKIGFLSGSSVFFGLDLGGQISYRRERYRVLQFSRVEPENERVLRKLVGRRREVKKPVYSCSIPAMTRLGSTWNLLRLERHCWREESAGTDRKEKIR